GSDNITVGNGADYVAGDSALPVTGSVTLANHRQVGDPAPQGSWSDVASVPNATGNPGAGEAGDDGNDSVLVGYGANHIYGNGRNQVDTGAGTDTVYGGSGTDFVVGHSTSAQVDTFYGADGSDVLVGGYGTDHLYGGGDADYIAGGPATIDAIDPADATLGTW